MPEHPPLPALSLDKAREDVGRVLSDHFAEDRITVEEFERRLELIYKASTPGDVRAQLAGLPNSAPDESGVAAPDSRPAPVSAYQPRASRKTFVAFMSGVTRRGEWSVPASLNVVAFMGGVELDLRHARLGAGVTNIRVIAFMGGAEITVGPNVRVETDGIAIMGGFEDRVAEPAYATPDGPVVRVTGIAFMGGVEVRVKVAEPWRRD